MEQNSTKQSVEQCLEDMLEKLKADPLKVTAEGVSAFWGPAKEAFSAYIDSMDRFDADLKARQAVLDQQGQTLDVQIQDLEMKIKNIEATSRDAASRGNLDAAATADEEAEDLRRQMSTARRKRRIANGTELRGDERLYTAIKEAKAGYDASFALCQGAVREAIEIVREWRENFEALEKTTKFEALRGPGDAGATEKRWLKIDKNFRREHYQQLEEQAAIQRAQEKAE